MLVLGFPEERLPCSRRPWTCQKSGQTNLLPIISGRVPVLDFEFAHGQSGFQPTVENLPKKAAMEVVDFFVEFGGGFFQNAHEKSADKNPPAKNKNPPAHNPPPPPKIRQPGPKIRRKTYQQIRPSNLQVHARLFQLRRLARGGVFRAWILLFGCLLPQVLLVGRTRFAAHPSMQRF